MADPRTLSSTSMSARVRANSDDDCWTIDSSPLGPKKRMDDIELPYAPIEQPSNDQLDATTIGFDPYSHTSARNRKSSQSQTKSLIDSENYDVGIQSENVLEMEEESESSMRDFDPSNSAAVTNSGLLLTHRRPPVPINTNPMNSPHISTGRPSPTNHEFEDDNDPRKKRDVRFSGLQGTRLYRERLEVENPWSANGPAGVDPFLYQLQRLFSFARIGVLVSALVLIVGTAVLIQHVREPRNATTKNFLSSEKGTTIDWDASDIRGNYAFDQLDYQSVQVRPQPLTPPDKIVLLPFDPSLFDPTLLRRRDSHPHRRLFLDWKRKLSELHAEFDAWVERHKKVYHTEQEREYRFNVWTENHQRIIEKNEQHGLCKMTNQPVFGSNHFQDLTDEEFENNFLNARHTPIAKKLQKRALSSGTLGPHIPSVRHPDVHRRYLEMTGQEQLSPVKTSDSFSCKWYDLSCSLKYVVKNVLYGFYGISKTMEPAYDSNTYPKHVDWRETGAVTNIRAQDSCGACWAITAVETVESATFISSGKLYDLSETEPIICQASCQMCYGGWPEDAFDYVIQQGGLPLEKDLPYNADWLLSLTQATRGESEKMSVNDAFSVVQKVCPASSSNGKNDNKHRYTSTSYTRYGKIAGYGYATDRCVCYTDGNGCDCKSQNEGLAVANIATYGPGVVCVDASTWKEYTTGIITVDSGCSSAFLDVNHCVQVVGYAFSTEGENDNNGNKNGNNGDKNGNNNNNNNRNGHNRGREMKDDNNNGKDKNNNVKRVGYWIVRNQWSTYWGMDGYAYVAMGANTCGILNDMIQVYS